MSVDAFDKVFNDWLHGVQWQERVRQEVANATELVSTLQKRGHTVTCNYLNRSLCVDGKLTITMRVAREEKHFLLLEWVDRHMGTAKEKA